MIGSSSDRDYCGAIDEHNILNAASIDLAVACVLFSRGPRNFEISSCSTSDTVFSTMREKPMSSKRGSISMSKFTMLLNLQPLYVDQNDEILVSD